MKISLFKGKKFAFMHFLAKDRVSPIFFVFFA